MKPEKTALLTGAGSKLARTLALALAQNGWNLALSFCKSEDKALALQKEILSLGVKCECYFCDLEKEETFAALIDSIYKKFPGLCLLVNNAAVFQKEESGASHMQINFNAPVALSRLMAAKCATGQIINILDTDITKPEHPYGAYAESKKALADFTRTSAIDMAPGFRVNAIAPGPIQARDASDEEYIKRLEKKLPLGRRASAQDLADTLLFLADNNGITGQIIFVDSGAHLLG